MMMDAISEYLCYILRHNPGTINLKLDSHGWASVSELAEKTKDYSLTISQIITIVEKCKKERFSLDYKNKRIRANHGHTVDIDIDLKSEQPPMYLLHGTADISEKAIIKGGINSGNRLFVHLTNNKKLVMSAGLRHGRVIVFIVEAIKMYKVGYKFYKASSDVWLVKYVPAKYLLNVMK